MPKKSFEDLLDMAKQLYVVTRDMDRDHAEIEIVRVLGELYSAGSMEMIDELQTHFAAK